MKHLCDSNVFLALALEQHAHHTLAADWFRNLAESETAVFCRATGTSFLRLLTQKIAPDYVPMTNRHAWAVLERLMEDGAIDFEAEPAALEHVWRQLSDIRTASPKVWMDAYLAAFAITGGIRLVTLDKDFRKFKAHGLDLLLLA